MENLNNRLKLATDITTRLVSEAAMARQSWALFEALNGRDDQQRDAMRKKVDKLDLREEYRGIADALVRDALLTLMRMSDPPNKRRLSLCQLSKLLQDSDLCEARMADARIRYPEAPDGLGESDEAIRGKAIGALTALVPPIWQDDSPPTDRELFDLRTKLVDVRDRALAHSLVIRAVDLPEFNEIRKLLSAVGDAVDYAQIIFHGGVVPWKSDFDIRIRKANEFWDLCQDGFR